MQLCRWPDVDFEHGLEWQGWPPWLGRGGGGGGVHFINCFPYSFLSGCIQQGSCEHLDSWNCRGEGCISSSGLHMVPNPCVCITAGHHLLYLHFTSPRLQAGKSRSAQGLTFLQVFEAGHMVPMDQPTNVSLTLHCCSLTSHCHSPHTATHLTLPLTSHCHSPYTLPLTTHCHSPHTATHLTLLFTTHCHSPHTATHPTLPPTTHCHSPHTTTHHTLPLTSHCHSPHTATHLTLPLTTHCHSPHTATHLTLPLTSHCHSPHTATHLTLPLSTHCHSPHVAAPCAHTTQ